MTGDSATTRNQEANLIDLVGRLAGNPAGRAAVHIRLSMLRPHNRRDHHVRIARAVMADQIRTYSGQVFSLSNGDLVFVCNWTDRPGIDQAIGKLRHLFRADPLTRDAGGAGNEAFCIWYSFEVDAEALAAVLRGIKKASEPDPSAPPAPPRKPLQPLNPQILGQVEEVLRQADLSMLIQRQWVCAMMPRLSAPEPIVQEFYVGIGQLQQRVLPTVDLASNRYLFQHLTETLDRRMLSLLVNAGEPKEGSRLSVNVNVSTLLSNDFLAFDARLNSASRGAIAFELQVSDVFADYANFAFARDHLQSKGYQVAIDAVTHLTLPFVDREAMNADLIKIYWSTDLADYLEGDNAKRMKDFVARAGAGRVILCRVDDENAIEIGNGLGIQLFQGRHVDAALAASQEARKAKQQQDLNSARRAAAIR